MIHRSTETVESAPPIAAESEKSTPSRPLIVGAVDDPAETHADDRAAEVLRAIALGASATLPAAPSIESRIRRSVAPSRSAGAEGGTLEADISAEIESSRGTGSRIQRSARDPLEAGFGRDFSSVRVHDDDKSDRINRSIGASAFTVGRDIFFAAGQYRPLERSGQSLLAHELAHVEQNQAVPASRIQRSSLAVIRRNPQARDAIMDLGAGKFGDAATKAAGINATDVGRSGR